MILAIGHASSTTLRLLWQRTRRHVRLLLTLMLASALPTPSPAGVSPSTPVQRPHLRAREPGTLRVSVVIPAYRAAGTIGDAVASVLAQTLPADEVIVVDDSGQSGDTALAAALAPFGAQVRLECKPNGGAASARNHGMALAQGEWVAFLDADDTWEPNKLERQIDVLLAHPEVGMVGAHLFVQEPGAARQPDPDIDPTLFNRVLRADEGRSFHAAAMFWTGTVMVRRELLAEDRFDEALSTAEDRDLWFRLLHKAPGYLLGEPLATCVLQPGSLSRTQVDRDMTNLLLIIHRHREQMGETEYAQAKARTHARWVAQLRAQGRGNETLVPAWQALVHAPSARAAFRVARAGVSALRPQVAAPVAAGRLEVQSVRTLAELQALAPEWQTLHDACPAATVSTTWEWLCTWWEVFGAGRELQLLLARDEGRLVGIAPLLQRAVPRLRLGQVQRLELLASGEPEADEIHTEYLDFLIAPGRETEVAGAFWQAIAARPQWDELRLVSVPGASRLRMALRDAAAHPAMRVRERERPKAVVIPLEATAAEFMAAQGRKMREDLRRHKRMLEQHGALRLVRAGTVEELRALFPVFMQLHQALWTSRGEPGCFASAAFTTFHQRVSERLFARGQTHLHVLYVGDKPLAARYGFHRGTRMFEYQSGNDPAFDPRISVGMVSMQLCMEDAVARGMSEYDMGEGPRPYKLRWRHVLRTTHEIEVSRRNLSMALADTLDGATATLRRWRRATKASPAASPAEPGADADKGSAAG